MDELMERIMALSMEGFGCSQIMVKLALEMQGKENEDMMRALCGLRGGMVTRRACGTLTGGCCMLGYFCGSGLPHEATGKGYPNMIADFANWFEEHFQSCECAQLVGPTKEERMQTCPSIMKESFEKCMELLYANGYDPNESP